MGDEDRVEELELQVKELTQKLDAMTGGGRRAMADLTDEELATYQKVRDIVVADWGEFCGINDCFRCIQICRVCKICGTCQVCQVCVACIHECSCGPCGSVPLGGGGGLGRFGGLGG